MIFTNLISFLFHTKICFQKYNVMQNNHILLFLVRLVVVNNHEYQLKLGKRPETYLRLFQTPTREHFCKNN